MLTKHSVTTNSSITTGIVKQCSNPSIVNETSATEKLSVKPDILLGVHNSPYSARHLPGYLKDWDLKGRCYISYYILIDYVLNDWTV